MCPDDKTAPGVTTTSVPSSATPSALALVIVWSAVEPHRLAEVAFVQEPLIVGRRHAGVALDQYAYWQPQRPGELLAGPMLSTLLGASSISKKQLLITPTDVGLHVKNVGERELSVNGVVCTEATAYPGGTIMLTGEVGFLVVRRHLVMPALVGRVPLHPFGLPDRAGIIGESPGAWKLRDDLAIAAAMLHHVLLLGESGAGKRSAAELLHMLSSRARGPFIIRNIATLADNLASSELFGNLKGYPNAGDPARLGLFGEAREGIGFLDEMGDCSPAIQAALLTALDEGTGVYTPLGGKQLPAEARIVAATNRDLRMFRIDLLARFIKRVLLPPLRDRAEDIALILRHLLETHEKAERQQAETNRWPVPPPRRVSGAFVDALVRAVLPANVRDLKVLFAESLAESPPGHLRMPKSMMGPGQPSRPTAPPPSVTEPPPRGKAPPSTERATTASAPRAEELPSKEKAADALAATKGNVTQAGELLGISRAAMQRLMKKYGLKGTS